MSGAITIAGRCAHCGCDGASRTEDGVWSCSAEHLLLARILGEYSAPVSRTSRSNGSGALTRTRAEQVARVTVTRAERLRATAIRHLRTACEDADELLGQAAEAARVGNAGAAVEPLDEVRRLAASIVRALHRPVPLRRTPDAPPGPLDEDRVLAALVILEELDTQLRDASVGYRGAGWRAAELAEKLIAAIDRLSHAAVSGRTRAHAVRVEDGAA